MFSKEEGDVQSWAAGSRASCSLATGRGEIQMEEEVEKAPYKSSL